MKKAKWILLAMLMAISSMSVSGQKHRTASIPADKKDIIDRFVAGTLDPSYTPALFWGHFGNDMKLGEGALRAHLQFYLQGGADILKVQNELPMPRVDDLTMETPLVPEDFYRPVLELIMQINDIAGKDVYVMPTILSAHQLARQGLGDKRIMEFSVSRPEAYKRLLDSYNAAILWLIHECKVAGIEAFFCATQGGEKKFYELKVPGGFFETFIRPYDLQVMMEANKDTKVSILHICDWEGPMDDLTRYLDYPCNMVNVPLTIDGKPLSAKETFKLFGKPVLGGFDRKGEIGTASPEKIAEMTRDIIAQGPKGRLMVSADCSIPSPLKNADKIHAAVSAAHSCTSTESAQPIEQREPSNSLERPSRDRGRRSQPKGEQMLMSEAMAKSFITRFPDPDVIRWGRDPNHFCWQAGYMMFALEHLWRQTNDSTYLNYIRRYADQNVRPDGTLPLFVPRALDNFIPGYACLLLYELTGEDRYAKAAETIRRGFDDYPRNKYGVFYHSLKLQQLWVDGVFMGQIFLARYAKTMNHPEDYDEVVRQLQGCIDLCQKDNGSFYHGWAEKGKADWSQNGDGHSAESWSEGQGWLAVLFADVFDCLPQNQPGREKLMEAMKKFCHGLKGSQDQQTGMWCQVPDKPLEPGNWNETSGTGMYIYLLQKAINCGFIPYVDFQPVVDKAYEGIKNKAICNADGAYNLIDCSSIGIKRSYEEYISQPREISTYAAFASFILGTGILEHRHIADM